MKYHDSHADSQVKMQSAIQLLEEHNLAYTPINYAVAYDYVTGTNHRLIGLLNEYIQAQNIDAYAFESLYNEFIANHPDRDASSVYRLNETIGHLGHACTSSNQVVGALDESISEQCNESGMPELKSLLNELKSTQVKMSACVKEAQEQAESIKNELESAKMEAITDPLTKLLNRQGLKKMFEAYVTGAKDVKLSAAMVDIDHFKKFNDDYGHLIGDVILRRIAKLLLDVIGSKGEAFRYGGEEFLILIPDTELDAATNMIEDIRSRVEKLRFVSAKTKQRLPKITISAGVTQFSLGEQIDNLISRADEALYKAKNAGRNQINSTFHSR